MGGTKSINRIIEADKFFLRSFLFFCTCACKRKETNQRKENQRKSKELVRSLFKNFRSQEPVNFFQIPTSSNRGYDRGTPPVPPVPPIKKHRFLHNKYYHYMSHLMFLWIATLTSFAVLDFLLAQLCRSFGFASTRFELRSPGFTRPEIRRNDGERGRGNPQHNPAIYYKFPVELFLSSSSCLISTL